MKYEVWFQFRLEAPLGRSQWKWDYLDDNGKGFSREDAEDVAAQLKVRDNILPSSVMVQEHTAFVTIERACSERRKTEC